MSTISTITSSTRSSAASSGNIRFETDTKKLVAHDGTRWREYRGRGMCVDLSDTQSNLLQTTPEGADDNFVVLAYATDTNDFLIYDGSVWYIYNND